ncbi:MAG: putative DNA binding domain-containing protein [Bacteroidetes bacterium]|nr:putative DNA binding domain-containing protein [Bacteroidota bacterium]
MAKKENQNIECKQSWRDEFLKTICAFANSHGGTLYVGLNDTGKIVGVENAKKLLEDVPNKIADMLHIIADVSMKREKSKEYILIKVKPYKTSVSFRGKYYSRSGSTTQELNGAELQNFLLEKSGVSWESIVEERATLKDIDPNTITKFKELAAKRFPAAAKEKSVTSLLEKLHLLHKGKPTRAAILLFGKDPRKFYISAYIKIGRFKDDAALVSMDDIYGNLFQQAEDTIEILKKKYLQSEITIKKLHREEELEYPEPALREAIVNSIVHRDYSDVHTQLKIYPDHLSLWNNGELSQKLTIEKLKEKHSSYPRNKLIADVFYKAAYIEAWGHGTVKMIEECKKAGLPEPLYEEDGGGMLITFRKDIYTEEYLLKIGLNERQVKAILFIKEAGSISNSKYQSINNCSRNTATNDLRGLITKKILLQKGSGVGAGSEYILAKK